VTFSHNRSPLLFDISHLNTICHQRGLNLKIEIVFEPRKFDGVPYAQLANQNLLHLAVHSRVVDLVLAEQRGVRGGRPAAEGARARVPGNGLCQQLARRSRPRYVLPGTVCDQNLIALVRPSKRSQFHGSVAHDSRAAPRPPTSGGVGGGVGNPGAGDRQRNRYR